MTAGENPESGALVRRPRKVFPMRKCGWMMLVALACACGGGSGKKQNKDAGNNLDGGNGNLSCDRTGITQEPGWGKAPPWTTADTEACDAACPGGEDSCRMSKCHGYADFVECYNEEYVSCATKTGEPCRSEYELLVCCSTTECPNASSQQEFTDCVNANCAKPSDDFNTCLNDKVDSPASTTCDNQAFATCVAGADAGVSADAGTCDTSKVKPKAGYSGTPTFTAADLAACNTACANLSFTDQASCHSSKCPGYEAYSACQNAEIAACLSKPGAGCRKPWENLECCAEAACSTNATATCLHDSCGGEQTAFASCVQTKSSATCAASAQTACLATGDAGAGPADAGPDGAVGHAVQGLERANPGARHIVTRTVTPPLHPR
jgi:hypothetical protein